MKIELCFQRGGRNTISYEALTITPEGSHVGVNLNMDRFFEAYENGVPYDEVVNKATDVAEQGIKESPAVDIVSLTNYDIMKEKLAMEVVSSEANYPGAVRYLKQFENELAERKSDKNAKWFEYGRSQALGKLNVEKLLLSTIISKEVAVYRLPSDSIP